MAGSPGADSEAEAEALSNANLEAHNKTSVMPLLPPPKSVSSNSCGAS